MKTYWRFWLTLLLIFILLAGSMEAGQDQPSAQEQFFEANRAYIDSRYSAAVEGYRKLVDGGYASGHIYYNLGNAYFRLGEIGQAILFYERARLLIPRDDDLLFNLSHARAQTVDDTGDVQTVALNDFVGLDSLNLIEVFWAFSVISISFFALLSIRLFTKAEWSFYLSILLSILITIGACALGLKWYDRHTDDRAVVLAEEIAVRAGPDPGDTVLFKIHMGTVVHYERSEDGWVLLYLSKEQRGWTQTGLLERISPRNIDS